MRKSRLTDSSGTHRGHRGSLVGGLGVLGLLCGLVLAVGVVSASAEISHRYLSQLTGFKDPSALAVDGSGDLYVVDRFAKTVDRFSSAGVPLVFSATESYVDGSKLTGISGKSFEEPDGVAVNDETGDVYVSDKAANVVDVFSSSGVYLKQLTGTPTGAGGAEVPFEGPAGLTVGRAAPHDLYVTDPAREVVDVFSAGGVYLSQFGAGVLGGSYGESVVFNGALEDAYVGDSGPDEVFVFDSSGSLVEKWNGKNTPQGPFGGYVYVGLDPTTGEVYVADTRADVVDEFGASSSEEYLGQLTGTPTGAEGAEVPFHEPEAVATGGSGGDLYVADFLGGSGGVVDVFGPDVVLPDVVTEAAGVSAVEGVAGARLSGTVTPEKAGAVTCRFEWGTTASLGSTAPCTEPAGPIAEGESPVAVHATLAGLRSGTTYYYRLQASNVNGTNSGIASQTQQFTTSGASEESSSKVSGSSASLRARLLDPLGVDVSYYFEYGPTIAYGKDAPSLTTAEPDGVELGTVTGEREVEQHVQGLTAGTVYHYRAVTVVESAPGVYEAYDGPDQTFTTQGSSGASSLIDGREWELVSPPDKHGSGLEPIRREGGDIQAAGDGDAIAYIADGPVTGEPAGNRALEQSQVLSKRGPDGWETEDIATRNEAPAEYALGGGPEYRLFSTDLSVALLEPRSGTALSAQAAAQTPYVHPTEAGTYQPGFDPTEDGVYEPLATSGLLPHGTQTAKVEFEGASPDLSHVVVTSTEALAPQEIAAATPGASNVYEWSAGKLRLVSVLPDGRPASEPHGGEAGQAALLGGGGKLTVRGAVSSDGSRIVWDTSSGEPHLYLRDMEKGETVQLDTPQPGVKETPAEEGETPEPKFQGATSDASSEVSRVFFTDSKRLTAGARAVTNKPDLYVAEVLPGATHLEVHVTDLTEGAPDEESGDVRGLVLGYSEDGSYVYYAANGRLAGVAARGDCDEVSELDTGTCTIYEDHYNGTSWGSPVVVATVSEADEPDWGGGNGSPAAQTARVSANGRFLSFMSERSLTGYDNRDAVSGELDEEVFLYDAAAEHLVCASCDPSGARPTGVLATGERQTELPSLLVERTEAWPDRWLAANVPTWTPIAVGEAQYQSRYLSNSGRLFFDSSDALVPGDGNGLEDVYEYEPQGCAAANDGGGCIGLISSGESDEESAFLDASESGDDVFFLTSAKLAPQDYDKGLDVYDAHVCTAEEPCPSAVVSTPPCDTAESCKAAVTPQPTILGAPATATFSGPGNPRSAPTAAVKSKSLTNAQKLANALKACKKEAKRKRAGCEAQARKRYGPKPKPKAKAKKKSAKSTTSDRRGK